MPLAAENIVLHHPMRGEPDPDSDDPLRGGIGHFDGLCAVILGGGCFWGVEEIFWQVPGVYTTAVGYAGGYTPNPTYEEVCSARTGHTEAVLVVFDPAVIDLTGILKIFWETHDPTQEMRQGNDVGTQYRSGIYTHDDTQARIAREVIAELAATGTHAVTEVLPEADYYPAEDYHQRYFEKHPGQGYCAFVVAPKVEKFRRTFASKRRLA